MILPCLRVAGNLKVSFFEWLALGIKVEVFEVPSDDLWLKARVLCSPLRPSGPLLRGLHGISWSGGLGRNRRDGHFFRPPTSLALLGLSPSPLWPHTAMPCLPGQRSSPISRVPWPRPQPLPFSQQRLTRIQGIPLRGAAVRQCDSSLERPRQSGHFAGNSERERSILEQNPFQVPLLSQADGSHRQVCQPNVTSRHMLRPPGG